MSVTDSLDQIHLLVQDSELESLAALVGEASSPDIADLLYRLPAVDAAVVYRLLPKDKAIDVFEILDSAAQADLVTELAETEVVNVFEALDPDDIVGLLDELPAKVTKRLLRTLSPRQRTATAPILGYPHGSVGRRMTPEYVSARLDEPVSNVLVRLQRNADNYETVYTVPVVDNARVLVGVCSLRDLLTADDTALIQEIMSVPASVRTLDGDESSARRLMDAGVLALPVVDSEDRLVGLFTLDDAVRIIRTEDAEDAARAGGTEPLRRTYMLTTPFHMTRSRITWLLILAVSAILTVKVLDIFEDPLSVYPLALFIPLLTGTGGNTGSQAATTVTRSLAMNELSTADTLRVAFKEIRTGAMLGLVLGLIGFGLAAVVFGPDIGVVIGLTLLAICAMAATVGGIMPMLASTVRADPAVFSTPFISTFADATGLIIYFSIAKAILGI
ncbi:MAG TPA: magnesium transporter [Beutenbergiaceae bacterium]|nr:magnesium transporter [Beutenbergiaceae bacterium]